MRNYLFNILVSIIFLSVACETLTKVSVEELNYEITLYSVLPDTIRECSGMKIDDSGIYVINDGGSGPLIFHVNAVGEEMVRIISVDGAQNIDWEAITAYEDEFLVCDFGNNLGKRKDLAIYHVDRSTFKVNKKVDFAYPDQVEFDNPVHNFDCEGMVIMNDEYVLFTKNRANKNSNIYTSPIGESNFTFRDSIPVPGQVTDACYHEESNTIVLLSYNYSVLGGFQSQLTIVKPLENRKFNVVKSFEIEYREQFEAIDHLKGNTFLIGSENVYAKGGNLYKIEISGL